MASQTEMHRDAQHATVPEMDHQWLPFTPNRDFLADPRLFARAQGLYYYSLEGKAILDGSSGLFTTPAGHGRVEIADAVRNQILELDFTSSFLRSHEKSFAVAGRLAKLLPPELDTLFFASSGSEAVDTAMKLSLAYHRARGEASRTLFVSRERSYHGVNVGGSMLGGIANNRRSFQGIGIPVVHMRHTQTAERFVPGQPSTGADLADDLLRFVQLYGAENIAACFVEPIAGSTGVLVPPVGYLDRLREICTEYGILLVFDEVICGFGRTGKPFAAESFGVTPDIITMAKAITNGNIPMAAVAISRTIHRTFMDISPQHTIEFFHGYTWSGHPVACAAALATLDIYESENLFARAQELSSYFLDLVFSLCGVRGISDVRGYGMLAGLDIDPAVVGMSGYELQKRLYDHGLHIKTTGNSAIFAPPFIAEKADLDHMIDTFRNVLTGGA
ncbi:MAG: omega amino acid--pyruvate aminotransferase [Acidobacteriaceae bacterium]|jgi:beta-alanine--pyruvate transaminase|nr:omega amino acid--pyruvate aminotransferase [Acidobacteriaceae bacterium]